MDGLNEIDSLLAQVEDKFKSLKTGEDELPYRVIHFKNNPADKEIEAEEAEYEAIEKENERLRARLSLLEAGTGANVTSRIDEAVDNFHKIESLKQKLAEQENRNQKIARTLKESAKKYRQACKLLLGFNIEGLRDNVYRVAHQEAPNQGEKLYFKVSPDGTVNVQDNELSRKFSHHKSMYLEGGDSCPAYLAAIAMEYFKSSTESADVTMSETMMTTMRPQ